MKIADMNPNVTQWLPPMLTGDRRRKVGAWSFVDRMGMDGHAERWVYHYGTRMIEFRFDGEWEVSYTNTGWGSVSDQAGMNKILKNFGYYYSRKGGARIEYVG